MHAKPSTPRRIAVGVVALAAVAALSGCERSGFDRDTAAEVGTAKVTRAEVLGAVDRALAGAPTLSRLDLTELHLTAKIRLKLYELEAAKRGIAITADQVTAARAALDQQANGDLVRAAAAVGFAEPDLDEVIRPIAYDSVLAAETLKTGPVTDAELDTFVQQHASDFADQSHVAHILVTDEALAKKLYAQIKAGGDFAALAAQNSIDGSKDNGGDLGPAPKGTYVPEFEAAVWSAKPGDVVGPVKTQYGWHIIKVIELRKFADIKEQVRAAAGPSVGRARLGALLLSGGAPVVVNPRFGRWDSGNGRIIPPKVDTTEPSIQYRDHSSPGLDELTDPSQSP